MQRSSLESIFTRLREPGLSPEERSSLVREVNELFAANAARVYGICLVWVRDEQRARELAQDVFRTAWQQRDTFRGPDFGAWVRGIARNVCRRAMNRRQELLLDDGVLDPTDPASSVLKGVLADEREELLLQAVAGLSPHEQDVVYRRYVLEMTDAEIDAEMKVDTGITAHALLQNVKRHLRSSLSVLLRERGHGTSFFRTTFT